VAKLTTSGKTAPVYAISLPAAYQKSEHCSDVAASREPIIDDHHPPDADHRSEREREVLSAAQRFSKCRRTVR
jgi:hypothetical protein